MILWSSISAVKQSIKYQCFFSKKAFIRIGIAD
ncbi:MAG: hypothetical protein ACI85E_001989 [Marinomonas primoryensis]|jgi:hypothetical protein